LPYAIRHHIERTLDDEEKLALALVVVSRRSWHLGRRSDLDEPVALVRLQQSHFVPEHPGGCAGPHDDLLRSLAEEVPIEIIGKYTQVKRKGAVHYDAAAAALRLM
jgi:hypothetical protein